MITTTYTVRISFAPPDGTRMDSLFDAMVNQLPDRLDVEQWEDFQGNPACYPYVEVTSSSLKDAKEINKILYRYLDYNVGAKVDV